MKRLLFLLYIASIAICSNAYEKVSMNVKVNGASRNMVVFLPNTIEENMPLMIITHGMNQNPEYQYDADKIYLMVDTAKFVAAYLRSNGTTWDTGGTGDQNFVENSIIELYKKYNIDRHRVYWSGFSMGSMLIYHCMHNMQGKIAAFAPTSGIQFSEQPWNKCKKPVNLIHCHAKGDETFHINGNPGQYSYTIRDYVFNMAKMNKYTKTSKNTGYNPGSWYVGDMETWTNDNGNVVKLFLYENGGHWPQQANGWEIWKFCKQFSLADEELDPLPIIPDYEYSLSDADELTKLRTLDGKILMVTDIEKKNIFYNNPGIDNPQNTRIGDFSLIKDNDYCYFKFTKVTDADSQASGQLYTIQVTNEQGEGISLWGNNGYLNTPPGEWCLFALGLNNQYGQDKKNYGLWQVAYETGKGFTIRNVGAWDADSENTYISPISATPIAEKTYVRIFSKVTKTVKTGMEEVIGKPAKHVNDNIARDLTGRTIRNLNQYKGIYIKNGKKINK